MKLILSILLLIVAVFAVPGQPMLTDAGSTMQVMTSTGTATVTASNDLITENGVQATVQAGNTIQVRDGAMYMTTDMGAEKQINWTPEGVQMKLENQGVSIVMSMDLSMRGENPVYTVVSQKKLNTGREELNVEVEAEVDANTGEVETVSESISPPQNARIRMDSAQVRAMIEPEQARVRINNTLVNGSGELNLEITTPRGKTIQVHVVPGEGSTVTIDGVQVNTKETIEMEEDDINVGGRPLEFLPEQAQAKINANAQIREMALVKADNKLQYKIKAVEQKRFLGLLGVDIETETTVDVETGNAQARGPWWGFLAF